MFKIFIPIIVTFLLTMQSSAQESEFAMRFFGTGTNDIDRVKIPIRNKPVNIGATAFTIEFWMKADLADNPSPECTSGYDTWINGHIILDRDIYGAGDYGDYGISLYGGKIAFGVNNGSAAETLCSTISVADNQWHHIAVTRTLGGLMRIFIDGQPAGEVNGPGGNISYRVGRTTTWPNDPFIVLGAEKHDVGPSYPSYNGFLDELRISRGIRYNTAFFPPSRFKTDSKTLALYHFDEGSGTRLIDSSGAFGGPSHGVVKRGGPSQGPKWTRESPFAAKPNLLTPQNNVSVSSGVINFSWQPLAAAQQYTLRIFKPDNSVFYEGNYSPTSCDASVCSASVNISTPSQYRWRVLATMSNRTMRSLRYTLSVTP